MTRPLHDYRSKRDFSRTSEPQGEERAASRKAERIFMVQKHAATRLHWDFRLEWDGVLLSWAVTRGPSASVSAKRLAVRTEDHPLDYATFEGVIPKPEYGAGTVMLWDRGTWAPLGDVDEGLRKGRLKFLLSGERMQGAWTLVRMTPRAGEKRENWLLIKEKDAHAESDAEGLVKTHLTSVTTGRDMAEIAAGAAKKRQAKPRKARGRPMPAFRPVQLAKLHSSVPEGDDWLHEVKVDGYRCQAALGGGQVRLYTRNGLDWTTTFGALRPAFEALPCDSALIDGEVVAAGVENQAFSALQTRLKQGGALEYVAFDLLHLEGRDLTALPLQERKALLENLLAEGPAAIRYSTHIEGHGAKAWAQVCAAGREGLISKLACAPYHAGRHGSWIKLKCGQRQEFVIGGWRPSSSRGRPFASLLMGTFDGGRLVYRGRVGTGFDTRAFAELQPLLRHRARKTSPFDTVPPDQDKARWVTPDLVAEIRFTELTEAGHIRHGSFQGLRHDKAARQVGLDHPQAPEAAEEQEDTGSSDQVLGLRITHPERQVFASPPVTKLEVAQHYAALAKRMLPYLRHRPVSLLRCPGGTTRQCFFQKHRGEGMPAAIGKVAISDAAEDQDYISLSSAKSLVAATQMGTIEFHVWGAANAALDRPDRIVFDLDPDESLSFAAVRRGAYALREVLDDLRLPSVPMLTGGKGVHVIVPLKPAAGWDPVKLFARTVAVMLSDAAPDRFVATMSKTKRKGLIFIDWLRNERGATAVAPYSLRARPGAKVAVPVTWEELGRIASAGAFDIRSVADRLSETCPLQQVSRRPPVLDDKVLERLQRRMTS